MGRIVTARLTVFKVTFLSLVYEFADESSACLEGGTLSRRGVKTNTDKRNRRDLSFGELVITTNV